MIEERVPLFFLELAGCHGEPPYWTKLRNILSLLLPILPRERIGAANASTCSPPGVPSNLRALVSSLSPRDFSPARCRQIFHSASALHANGLRIKLQELENIVRHVGIDRQPELPRCRSPDRIVVRPR